MRISQKRLFLCCIVLSSIILSSCSKQGASTDKTSKIEFNKLISSARVTPDGKYAILQGYPKQVGVYEIESKKSVWQLEQGYTHAMDAQGTLLAIRTEEKAQNKLGIYRLSDGVLLAELQGEPATWAVDDAVFSHDSKTFMLSDQYRGGVAFYPLDNLPTTGKPAQVASINPTIIPRQTKLRNYSGHSEYIGFSAHDTTIFVRDLEARTLERWSVEATPHLQALTPLDGKKYAITPQNISHDGSVILECSLENFRTANVSLSGTIEDIKSIKVPLDIPRKVGAYHYSTPCNISPDKQWIAYGMHISERADMHYNLSIYHRINQAITQDLGDAHTQVRPAPILPQVKSLAFSPDSRYLFVTDYEHGLHIYTLAGETIKVEYLSGAQLKKTGELTDYTSRLATSNKGILLTAREHVVWVPVPK